MTWRQHGGIRVWEGPVSLLDAGENPAYRWSAVPVEHRQRPRSCGRPATGRRKHQEHGEPTCQVCHAAEAAYSRDYRNRKASA